MNTQVFRISRGDEYARAGSTDLIELLPVPGSHSLYMVKWVLEALVFAIAEREFVHLSGPTGSAKSSLLEALMVPDNFKTVCVALGYRPMPLRLYAVEMATYEAPGELYQRRALRDGTTFDEASRVVMALDDAARHRDHAYPLIWLREMGRVHSASVQGGLLNLMTKGDILLPDGRRIPGQGIGWIADSNYQAENDSTHTLVTLDDALKRRFSVNLTLDYLSPEQEAVVLCHLLLRAPWAMGNGRRPSADLVPGVVKLGSVIRKHRAEGNLQSVPPPTIYGYLAYLRMATALSHLSPQHVACLTLLGNASAEDRKVVPAVINEVWGLQADASDETVSVQNLF